MTLPVTQQPGLHSYVQFSTVAIDEVRRQQGVDSDSGVVAKRQEKSLGIQPTLAGRVVGFISSACLNPPSVAAGASYQSCGLSVLSSMSCCAVTACLGGCAADIALEQISCAYQKEETSGEVSCFVRCQPRSFYGMVQQTRGNVRDLVESTKNILPGTAARGNVAGEGQTPEAESENTGEEVKQKKKNDIEQESGPAGERTGVGVIKKKRQ